MIELGLRLEIIVVLGLLLLTVYLFISEIIRIDLAAIVIMVFVGILSMIPGLGNLADTNHLFDGFASNAVISIIAVMIIGAGLDRTGMMTKMASLIVRIGGRTESRLIPILSGTVGLISSFMQNVGAAALFLPVVARISSRTQIPISRLLMPMGFCAILGGTITMVGSSPLILLNDLILNINKSLPDVQKVDLFEMFDVTPIGLSLVLTGIIYFLIAGRWVLKSDPDNNNDSRDIYEYFQRIYSLNPEIHEVIIKPDSPLVGLPILDLIIQFRINIVGINFKGRTRIEPPADVMIEAPARLAVVASPDILKTFVEQNLLEIDPSKSTFSEELSADNAGIAEIVIPPDSDIIGKSAKEITIRKSFGISILALFRQGKCYSQASIEMPEKTIQRIGEIPFQSGDTLVCHTSWEALTRLEKREKRDFIVVTSDFPRDDFKPDKTRFALFFFLISISLILFTDTRLSLCLLIGAAGMILTDVLSIDEAYQSISWKTVFLLASLIPLGQAVQNTGTAEWIANNVVSLASGLPTIILQSALAILATIFTLVMSNVGATVLLVPLAINIALAAGADPGLFALTVAIATSNSFLIPTHQVNALIMGPGGYNVSDFIKAGSLMTLLFLVVSVGVINAIY